MKEISVRNPKINHQIKSNEVRVIDEGTMIGVLATVAAISLAKNKGLDLIEIDPHSQPPVCKIMEYGKYKYEQSKKEHSQRKHTVVTKELKIRPNIDTHDLIVKVKQTKFFLEDGHKVKIIMQFHGREIEYKKAGEAVIIDFLAQLEPLYKVDSPLKQDGKNLIVFISAQKK